MSTSGLIGSLLGGGTTGYLGGAAVDYAAEMAQRKREGLRRAAAFDTMRKREDTASERAYKSEQARLKREAEVKSSAAKNAFTTSRDETLHGYKMEERPPGASTGSYSKKPISETKKIEYLGTLADIYGSGVQDVGEKQGLFGSLIGREDEVENTTLRDRVYKAGNPSHIAMWEAANGEEPTATSNKQITEGNKPSGAVEKARKRMADAAKSADRSAKLEKAKGDLGELMMAEVDPGDIIDMAKTVTEEGVEALQKSGSFMSKINKWVANGLIDANQITGDAIVNALKKAYNVMASETDQREAYLPRK